VQLPWCLDLRVSSGDGSDAEEGSDKNLPDQITPQTKVKRAPLGKTKSLSSVILA
jgi:hypothetical protein